MLRAGLTPEAELALTPLQPFGARVQHRGGRGDIRDIPVAVLREWTKRHRILNLRGFTPFEDAKAMAAYCSTWGETLKWSFGEVLDLVEHEHPEDHLFDHEHLPLHWDGMYAAMIPEFQFFQCVQAPPPQAGGQTTFSDTTRVLENISPETRKRWEGISISYHLKQSSYYGGHITSPLIVPHPEGGSSILRFNEPASEGVKFLNQVDMAFHGAPKSEVKDLIEELRAACYEPRHLYKHQWVAGDILVADNYVLLHGRTAFVSRSPRHLRRVHILGTPPFRNPALH